MRGHGSVAQGNSENKMAEGGVPVVFPFTNYHKWERKPLCGVKKQHSCDTSTLLKQTRVVDTSKVLAPPKPLPKQCVDLDAAVLKVICDLI